MTFRSSKLSWQLAIGIHKAFHPNDQFLSHRSGVIVMHTPFLSMNSCLREIFPPMVYFHAYKLYISCMSMFYWFGCSILELLHILEVLKEYSHCIGNSVSRIYFQCILKSWFWPERSHYVIAVYPSDFTLCFYLRKQRDDNHYCE